jgi:hypothetical protein
VRGHHAEVLDEAVTRYLQWPTYRHQAVPETVACLNPAFKM